MRGIRGATWLDLIVFGWTGPGTVWFGLFVSVRQCSVMHGKAW